MNFRGLLRLKSPKGGILVHSLVKHFRHSLALFNPLLSPSSLNLASQENFATLRIYLFHSLLPHPFQILPSTPLLVQMTSHAHGEPFLLFVFSSLASLPGLRLLCEMWLKLIEQFLFTHPSGQRQWPELEIEKHYPSQWFMNTRNRQRRCGWEEERCWNAATCESLGGQWNFWPGIMYCTRGLWNVKIRYHISF